MSKQADIEKGNQLISEFMGAGNLGKNYPYQYHSSWDWLMPVITKIGEIDNQADIELAAKIEDANLPMFNTSIFCHKEELYKRVIQFIEWYNKTNNP